MNNAESNEVVVIINTHCEDETKQVTFQKKSLEPAYVKSDDWMKLWPVRITLNGVVTLLDLSAARQQ